MTLQAPLLLTLETSGDVCGIAITRGMTLLAEMTFRHEMHLSERLMGHIDTILQASDTPLEAIEAFAVGQGPGSFTGVRIGVMTIKTLAAILERPVYGIGSLLAFAGGYTGLRGPLVVPMLPCRAGVVYTMALRPETFPPQEVLAPTALSIAELAQALRPLGGNPILCCGPAAPRYETELRAALAEEGEPLRIVGPAYPPVVEVARLAGWRSQAGLPADDPLSLVPLYVSPPPITLPKALSVGP